MRSILWAEDSPSDQVLIRAALQQMPDPPAVEFVEDGVDLLAKLPEAKPGLVVLDLGMPRMGGMETLEEMQRRGIRVGTIVFTAHDGPGEARHCRSRGASDVIQKPQGYVEFVAAVQRICSHVAWTVAENAAPLARSTATLVIP